MKLKITYEYTIVAGFVPAVKKLQSKEVGTWLHSELAKGGFIIIKKVEELK